MTKKKAKTRTRKRVNGRVRQSDKEIAARVAKGKAEIREQMCPDEIQIPEVDMLRMENISLKLRTAQETAQRLRVEAQKVFQDVSSKLKIDSLANYSIGNDGVGTRKKVPDGAAQVAN